MDLLRAMIVGAAILLAFGGLETRPRNLPKWLPRTVLQSHRHRVCNPHFRDVRVGSPTDVAASFVL